MDAAHLQAQDKQPDTADPTAFLKLLQDLCDTAETLPSHMWVQNVQRERYLNGGGEASITRCIHEGRYIVARDIQVPLRPLEAERAALKVGHHLTCCWNLR